MGVHWTTFIGCFQVAIYSPADRLHPHRYKADESYQVGKPGMKPVECYLDIESVIALAKEHEVDAIHPGYGFLSENTTFARRCKEEGIVFIGPRFETIEVKTDGCTLALAVCAATFHYATLSWHSYTLAMGHCHHLNADLQQLRVFC